MAGHPPFHGLSPQPAAHGSEAQHAALDATLAALDATLAAYGVA
ncbi:hypothetical protein [Rugosimonospora acidiphila]